MKESLKFTIGLSALALASIFFGVCHVIIENNPVAIFPWFILSLFGLTLNVFGHHSKDNQIKNENSKNLFDFYEWIYLILLSIMAILPYSSCLFLEYYGFSMSYACLVSYTCLSGFISIGLYFILGFVCIGQIKRQKKYGVIHES